MKYITDEQGKWLIQGSARLLVEPSVAYLAERELETSQREEQELLDSLIPSIPTIEDRVTNAEVDIVTLEETIDTIFGGM